MDKIVYALNLIVDLVDINDVIDEKTISEYLSITGFDDYEVNQVLDLIALENNRNINAVRIFSREERVRFTADALSYLNKIYLSGILDIIAIDEIIEKAELDYNDKISTDVVKDITLVTLLEKRSININSDADKKIFQ